MSSLALLGLAHVSFVTAISNPHGAVVEWLTDRGGYFNPKQEIRPNATEGVVVTESIHEGELLLRVPWNSVLHPTRDIHEIDPSHTCETIRNLVHELDLGSDSEFAPYLAIVEQTPLHSLSLWSVAGRALLDEILGGVNQRLPPVGAFGQLEGNWYQACDGSRTDPLSTHAALWVLQRADEALLIPIHDWINHRNGKWLNARTAIQQGDKVEVYATRTIEAGEQVHLSHNLCEDCWGRHEGYGTPEILRDYGFLEPFPQRWSLFGDVEFDLDMDEQGNPHVKWLPDSLVQDGKDGWKIAVRILRKELKRLFRIRNIVWEQSKTALGMVQEEWETSWAYHQALVDAMTYALEDVQQTYNTTEEDVADKESCSVSNIDHYYDLAPQVDDLIYVPLTCENFHFNEHESYYNFEAIQSHYQQLRFSENSDNDVCLILDGILQICTSYRPHYHEFAVHFPARYLESVRRVAFVGGGDSMLLHEILKYPTLERVVGLELDQVVTRQSFKFFQTQPHFDDPRVEWWFGDATKSLLMLPQDYWGSFDLVLVDLSETVMAATVTEDLDIFSALALLLKPEGVMVKNELYMEHMSKTFDYTIQIFYESPKICRQVMAMGSNRVDFLHKELKDHRVGSLLFHQAFDPSKQLEHLYDYRDYSDHPAFSNDQRFRFIHDYRKNDARQVGACESKNKTTPHGESTRYGAGILMVVEAEGLLVELDTESVSDRLRKLADTQGLAPTHWISDEESGLVVLFLEEGLLVARSFREQQYIGFDFWLRKQFNFVESLRSSVSKEFGDGLFSSYRVIVGGKAAQDPSSLHDGPSLLSHDARNCDTAVDASDKFGLEDILVRVAMDESVGMVGYTKLEVAVLCGAEDEECLTMEALGYSGTVSRVVPYWTCPDLQDLESDTSPIWKMHQCELSMQGQLESSLSRENVQLDMFIVDSTASKDMIQVFSSIWSSYQNRAKYVKPRNLFVTWSEEGNEWGRNFLDQYRKDQHQPVVSHAVFRMYAEDATYELGIVGAGSIHEVNYFYDAEENLKKGLQDDAIVELVSIRGGNWVWDNAMNTKRYEPSNYDNQGAAEQYAEQVSLGRQTILQLELASDKEATPLSREVLASYLRTVLDGDMDIQETVQEDGTVIFVSVFPGGNMILMWDDRTHVDINYYSSDDRAKTANKFLGWFLEACHFDLQLVVRDDQPRGLGRVVNFKDDQQLSTKFVQSIMTEEWGENDEGF